MNIITQRFIIPISGKITLDVIDPNGNTKQHESFKNAIHDNLRDAILAHASASSGSSAYHITQASDWFASNHSEQHGKDGILLDQATFGSTVKSYTPTVSNVSEPYDFKLTGSSESVSNNTAQWIAEGTWLGENGSGSATSGSFSAMHIGNNFSLSAQGNPQFATEFASATSSGNDFTAFTLDDNDVARVTWAITIGTS